ncbi:hypothetical protein N8Z63_02500 [Octadecabacter sp.]|nr:hypothetical protein [Octadecabacter sp.]
MGKGQVVAAQSKCGALKARYEAGVGLNAKLICAQAPHDILRAVGVGDELYGSGAICLHAKHGLMDVREGSVHGDVARADDSVDIAYWLSHWRFGATG